MGAFLDGLFKVIRQFFELRQMWRLWIPLLVFLTFWIQYAKARWLARDKRGIAISALLLVAGAVGVYFLYGWLTNPAELEAAKPPRDPAGDRLVRNFMIILLWVIYAYNFAKAVFFAVVRKMAKDYRQLLMAIFVYAPFYALTTWFILRLFESAGS